MLTHAAGIVRGFAVGAAIALLVATMGCGERGTPESQVRAVIAEAERAAEARDLAGLMTLVSPGFRDGQGGDREELERSLRGYLVMHPALHLLTRVESLEFPYEDYARVRLTVGTLGREAAAATAFDLAADVHEVALELKLEGDDWQVVRAERRSARRD
jgi:hypothetical protein